MRVSLSPLSHTLSSSLSPFRHYLQLLISLSLSARRHLMWLFCRHILPYSVHQHAAYTIFAAQHGMQISFNIIACAMQMQFSPLPFRRHFFHLCVASSIGMDNTERIAT